MFLFLKDFAELTEMAGRGDSQKVDIIAGDHKNREREETDWYSLMDDSLHVYDLGKLAEKKYNGRELFRALLCCVDAC